ncbi:30S ribosomal protein S13 [Candidatus Bathyarchaeota archaeon]|nr:MAG: 30S ribosomal protein S13 [Candidatus Bathyarchaeota archaeon]
MSEEFKPIVRLCGVDLDGNKQVVYSIRKIKGVGINIATAICRKIGIDYKRKLGYLSEAELKKLEDTLMNIHKYGLQPYLFNRPRDPSSGKDLHLIGSDLLIRVKMDIELMKKIRCWKGIRHMYGLKVRGQRTRTTGRTGITVGVTRRAR